MATTDKMRRIFVNTTARSVCNIYNWDIFEAYYDTKFSDETTEESRIRKAIEATLMEKYKTNNLSAYNQDIQLMSNVINSAGNVTYETARDLENTNTLYYINLDPKKNSVYYEKIYDIGRNLQNISCNGLMAEIIKFIDWYNNNPGYMANTNFFDHLQSRIDQYILDNDLVNTNTALYSALNTFHKYQIWQTSNKIPEFSAAPTWGYVLGDTPSSTVELTYIQRQPMEKYKTISELNTLYPDESKYQIFISDYLDISNTIQNYWGHTVWHKLNGSRYTKETLTTSDIESLHSYCEENVRNKHNLHLVSSSSPAYDILYILYWTYNAGITFPLANASDAYENYKATRITQIGFDFSTV